ncbi:MAG: transcription-repair coupling factor [Rhodospirillaceae bacterium]|nr:transcription-repair coupling factor [Rhodospirillaceae bacterium]
MLKGQGSHLHIVSDDAQQSRIVNSLLFFCPNIEVLEFPAWDCVPYDRISPRPDVIARRINSLVKLAAFSRNDVPRKYVIVATVSAVLQRVPPISTFRGMERLVSKGSSIELDKFVLELTNIGYLRTEQVMEPGEFAIRGGLIDVFAPSANDPVRIELFGDIVESLRSFDPIDQRTIASIKQLVIVPMSEVILTNSSVEVFRRKYRDLFGAVTEEDSLYQNVSEGRTYPGVEHWLPLFYSKLETIFDYISEATVSLDHTVSEAANARLDLISDYYESRLRAKDMTSAKGWGLDDGLNIYNPVPAEQLFLSATEWSNIELDYKTIKLSPFVKTNLDETTVDHGARIGKKFVDSRNSTDANLYHDFQVYIEGQYSKGRRVLLSSQSSHSLERLNNWLSENHSSAPKFVSTYSDLSNEKLTSIGLIVLDLEHGFTCESLAVITEQDLFGDRLRLTKKTRRKKEAFIADVSALSTDDLVIHIDHGLGKYLGLQIISVGGAPHDCLKIAYAKDDALFVPVENIEVLSRFGSGQQITSLDKLGGIAWQAKKSKLKARIREIADDLIRVAAERKVKTAQTLLVPEGLYDEFCSGFNFVETEDQERAISDVMEDFAKGSPMDRLVCGDVGFGKTEVALRAAFIAAMSGQQVAIIVPTTLLARQHYATFQDRFSGYPIKVAQLSRLVLPKELDAVRTNLKAGSIDILIGTHSVLSNSTEFCDLGLLIVDEEQHFGVSHKEKLKQLKANVHVLTLTATPIPRTLQMALTGVRDLSLITTPPIDRLAVRTFVMPYDHVLIREAIVRERFRGGQTFYVCPRVSDINRLSTQLKKLVPEASFAAAHGKMSPIELEAVMTEFSDGKYDILLATNIIESGLDLPRVNTIIVHRSDMFGLSQLYQLRGRVGRSKTRAYAYLTVPAGKKLTETAKKRLDVMQTLDTLGAGFSLASHDLDIRGAGNLLGDEQSGHIKEVGIELYQQLLEDAVKTAQSGGKALTESQETFSPQITLGMPVLIPETYVKDLGTRLSLYRRAADLSDQTEIDDFASELVDRFGNLPREVSNLLDIMAIKGLCMLCNISKIDAGPKGAVLTLFKNEFPNPSGLIEFIGDQAGTVKVRSDHKIVVIRDWVRINDRMAGVNSILSKLVALASQEQFGK